jgi:hypothetical protein
MKKTFSVILLISFLAFQACKDDVAPKIILDGNVNIEHVLNQPFIEPGFVAIDDVDGDITASVTASSLNVDSAGLHLISYTVSDAEGNSAEVFRNVNVYNQMRSFEGDWSGEYVFPYPGINKLAYIDKISTSVTTNMNIIFKDFGGNSGANLEGTVMLTGVIEAPAIAFTSQTIGGLAFTAQSARIDSSFKKITIEYTVGTQNGVLVLAKQ